MKKILFIISYLVLNVCYAENWLNHSKILQASKEAYSLKQDCERISGEKCFDLGEYPSSVYSEIDLEVDDTSKPNYSKNEVQACADSAACDLIHSTKVCSDVQEYSIKNYDLLQVYCSKFLSYDKKLIKSIALDAVKLSAYQAELATKATLQTKEAAISYAQKLMACGNKVVAYMLVRNQPKALTTSQVDSLVQTYAPIKGLLETGSLTTAKEKIAAVVADGVVVTEADKAALIAEIDLCK
jgi:hypothetical protein